jgi:hypothetical protein
MTKSADTTTELVDRYIAMWNETDADRRRALIAQTWTPEAFYIDPLMQGTGHVGIDAMVRGVQERFPHHRFRRTGPVDSHNDRARFTWELAPEGGPPLVDGTDFALIAGDRLKSITGFLDHGPNQG